MPRQLNEQKYCSWCAKPVDYVSEWASTCTGCGYTNYINPSPCSSLIITRDKEVLILKRAIEPHKDMYDLPGGFLEIKDSSLEVAAYRELEEEVALTDKDITELCYLGSRTGDPYDYQDSFIRTIVFFYSAALLNKDKVMQIDEKENSRIRWMSEDELEQVSFAWENDKIMLKKFFKGVA